MAYSNSIRYQAVQLRKKGRSLKEICECFNISKSTASLWLRDVALSERATKRLLHVIKRGQFIGARNKHAKAVALDVRYLDEAKREIRLGPDYNRLMCAMLYWCEGAKSPKGVAFTNSDPDLVKTFLRLLRGSFKLNEEKFRVCIHLHSYHSSKRQLDFWSKITDINKQQFIKPYKKANSGKRIHKNYQGCVSVMYHSSDLARRLIAIAKAFLGHKGA